LSICGAFLRCYYSRSCAQTSRESKGIEVAKERTKGFIGQQAGSVSTSETAASELEASEQSDQTE